MSADPHLDPEGVTRPEGTRCRCGHAQRRHVPGWNHCGDCGCEHFVRPEVEGVTADERTHDEAILRAARRFFDDFVTLQPGRSYPWMPRDLLTALVEDYDRRAALTPEAPHG